MRVGGDRRVPELPGRHERVVLRGDDQRRDRDAAGHPQAARAVVVVRGVPEPVVGRRERVVELADGADPAQGREVEQAGPDPRLAPHAALQVAHEVPLVDCVPRPLESGDARRQIHRRRDGADGPQGVRRRGAGQPEREVAAQGVARHGHRRKPVDRGQLPDDRGRIRREARVVEAAREVLGLPAVALVEQHHVEAAGERLVGEPAHVVRPARPLEPVQGQQRRPRRGRRLPVAMRQHPRVRRDVEVPPHRGRQPRKVPRPAPRVQGHPVPAGETAGRNEIMRAVEVHACRTCSGAPESSARRPARPAVRPGRAGRREAGVGRAGPADGRSGSLPVPGGDQSPPAAEPRRAIRPPSRRSYTASAPRRYASGRSTSCSVIR